MKKQLTFLANLLIASSLWAQGTISPIRNGKLQTDIDFAGFKATNVGLAGGSAVTVNNNGTVTNVLPTDYPIGQLLVNGVAVTPSAASSDASTTVKGITKLSIAPVSATNPIAVGDNDSRMTNARTPTAHASTHVSAGTDPVTLSGSQITGGSFGPVNGSALIALTAANITASTTVGRNLLNLTNPSAVSFLQLNLDNSVTTQTASAQRTALGVGTSDSPIFTGLTVSGGTITGGSTGLSFAAGGTNQNITLTPSGTGQVVIPSGTTIAGGTTNPSRITLTQGIGSGISIQLYNTATNKFAFYVPGSGVPQFAGQSASVWGWSAGTDATAGSDIAFARNAAGVVEINNGTVGTYRDLILRNETATSIIASSTITGSNIKATAIGARAYNSAAISVANATLITLTLNSERWDSDTIHSTSTNTSRLTCNTAGKYLITANVAYDINATGYRVTRILLNGVTEIARDMRMPVTASDYTACIVTTIQDLTVTDYIEVQAYQTSGGALNVQSVGNYSPELSMVWEGP